MSENLISDSILDASLAPQPVAFILDGWDGMGWDTVGTGDATAQI